MRISVNRNDPGYNQEAHLYKVYVEGVYLQKCITIDTDLKIAVVYSTNEEGLVFIGNDSCLATETLDLSDNNVEVRKTNIKIDVASGAQQRDRNRQEN